MLRGDRDARVRDVGVAGPVAGRDAVGFLKVYQGEKETELLREAPLERLGRNEDQRLPARDAGGRHELLSRAIRGQLSERASDIVLASSRDSSARRDD